MRYRRVQLGLVAATHKTLITIVNSESYFFCNEQQTEQGLNNCCTAKEEKEKEEKKSSKRKEEKEKEYNNNVIRNTPLPPRELYFEEFWKIYPKKVGKAYAKKCFLKLSPTKELTNQIIEAIKRQKQSQMWQKDMGAFIPNPSTWLNQGRWEDDLTSNGFYKQGSEDSALSMNGNYTDEEKEIMIKEFMRKERND